MATAWAVCAINRVRRLSGRGPQAVSVRGGGLRRQHIEMRGPAGADPPVRGRQRHADPLQGPAQTQGLGLRDRQTINDAQSASRSGSSPRDHYARDAAGRNGVRTSLSPQSTKQEAESSSRNERRPREGAADGADCVAAALQCRRRFQPSHTAPRPHQVPKEHVENAGTRNNWLDSGPSRGDLSSPGIRPIEASKAAIGDVRLMSFRDIASAQIASWEVGVSL